MPWTTCSAPIRAATSAPATSVGSCTTRSGVQRLANGSMARARATAGRPNNAAAESANCSVTEERGGAAFSRIELSCNDNGTVDRTFTSVADVSGVACNFVWTISAAIAHASALKRTEQMRADFIANAGHELKTPLAALIGFIETLLGPARNSFRRTLTGRGFRPEPQIVKAALGPEAGLVGAADLARRESSAAAAGEA